MCEQAPRVLQRAAGGARRASAGDEPHVVHAAGTPGKDAPDRHGDLQRARLLLRQPGSDSI